MPIDVRKLESAVANTVSVIMVDENGDSDLALVSAGRLIWNTVGYANSVPNPSYVFTGLTVEEAATNRDNYFSTNPSELVDGVECLLLVTGETRGVKQVYTSKPASFIANTKGFSTFPDYPYATVSHLRTTDDGYELSDRFFDEDGGYVYRTHKISTYSITFYNVADVTDSTKSADYLASKCHMHLEMDQNRQALTDLCEIKAKTEAALRNKTDIVSVSNAYEDKYIDIVTFDIHLAVLDEIRTPYTSDTTPIERVILDTSQEVNGVRGGLIDAGSEEPNPDLDIYVDAPNNTP